MALLITPSRDVIRPVLLAAMLLCLAIVTSNACPRGCECMMDQTKVICSELDSFPIGLPATAIEILITRSSFSEIPIGAFANMPDLHHITLQYVAIGSIRRWAFHRIGTLQVEEPSMELIISDATIANIESEAFVQLEGFKRIIITRTNISIVATGAFNRFRNIKGFTMSNVYIPVIRSSTFTDFSNVQLFSFEQSGADVIESDAFAHFTNVERVRFFESTIGIMGSRFMTIDNAGDVKIFNNTFRLWKKCAFCGISALDVDIFNNVVTGSDGNVFSGMRGVRRLQVTKNTLPLIVARFFPYDLTELVFVENKVTTILCEDRGDDYPSNIQYQISENEIACDCRLNWLWLKWTETRAVREIAPGFLCATPEEVKESMQDFFMEVSSPRGINSPCDGLVAVNYCIDTPYATELVTVPSTSASRPNATPAAAAAIPTPEPNASPVMIETSWVSTLVVICLTLVAS